MRYFCTATYANTHTQTQPIQMASGPSDGLGTAPAPEQLRCLLITHNVCGIFDHMDDLHADPDRLKRWVKEKVKLSQILNTGGINHLGSDQEEEYDDDLNELLSMMDGEASEEELLAVVRRAWQKRSKRKRKGQRQRQGKKRYASAISRAPVRKLRATGAFSQCVPKTCSGPQGQGVLQVRTKGA